jgi:hypothetical protein
MAPGESKRTVGSADTAHLVFARGKEVAALLSQSLLNRMGQGANGRGVWPYRAFSIIEGHQQPPQGQVTDTEREWKFLVHTADIFGG